jgi:hypothetical protein
MYAGFRLGLMRSGTGSACIMAAGLAPARLDAARNAGLRRPEAMLTTRPGKRAVNRV